MLKEIGSNLYNFSYLKRKLDIEIKHAKKAQSDVFFLYFGIPNFDQQIAEHGLRRAFLTQIARFLLDKFPEPHIVGNLHDGHWLVILQEEILSFQEGVSEHAKQMQDLINHSFPELNIKVSHHEIHNLKKFKNSEELIEDLPLP